VILSIARTGLTSLRRDRGALVLSFVLPIVFFSIFAVIFGGKRSATPRVTVLAVDEDHTHASEKLIEGLAGESLDVRSRPAPKRGVEQPAYTAASAEAAVRAGEAPIALIVPSGFSEHALAGGAGSEEAGVELLRDPSDPIASQVVEGLLQRTAMTSLPEVMAGQGVKLMDPFVGGFTPEQRKHVEEGLEALRTRRGVATAGPEGGMLIPVRGRDVVGPARNESMISFYAAAIGVMFLLFTASAAGGSLLDEAESGTLERVLASRVTMGALLGGKLLWSASLAFAQLALMFVWAWLVFGLDLLPHLAGFAVMGISTAFAVAAFGMVLASACRTRAQLGALSTLLVLVMSSIGGSMFPRFLMPEAMQKAGLLTLNAWAIDGFTKVFWRDEPLVSLWPQVLFLLAAGAVLLALARRLARRWERG
jgi:ABC-2 type transport system permease protein